MENSEDIAHKLISNSVSNDSIDRVIPRTDYLSIKSAVKEISIIAYPTMFFFLSLFLSQTINFIFLGHTLQTKEEKENCLNGIGVSTLYINCAFFSICIGFVSGFDTCGSNAYGAKNIRLFCLYYHRALLISLIVTFLLLILHFFTAIEVLTLFGIEEEVLEFARSYIKIEMCFVIFDVMFHLNFRYINIIEKSYINMIILLITLVFHILWCYIFIIELELKAMGAALSVLITSFLNALLSFGYIIFINPVPGSFFFFTKESFTGWWEYLKIALPTAFLVCAEWWGFELQSIIAIWIGKFSYTVHILLANFCVNLFTINAGFGTAAVLLVGKAIGDGNIYLVKRYTKIVTLYALIFMSAVLIVILCLKGILLKMYVDEDDVAQKGEEVIPYLCIMEFFDVIQTIFQNICRGIGKQLGASLIAFSNFYVLQTGLSILFGKVLGMGVNGIWLSMAIGMTLCSIAYIIIWTTFDFEKIKSDTMNRVCLDAEYINSEKKDIHITNGNEESDYDYSI